MNQKTDVNEEKHCNFGIIRVLIYQLLATVILASIIWFYAGKVAGYSSVLGGLICLVPNIFLGTRLMLSSRNVRGILRAAYLGELGKVILTTLLFGLVFFMVKPLNAMYLFLSFMIVQFAVSLELLNKEK